MNKTAQIIHLLRVLEADAFGTAGRTTTHRVATTLVTGATRHESQEFTYSAGLSQQTVELSPIAASQPGQFLWLTATQPLGVRLNDAAATLLSGVYQLMLAVSAVSSLFITPPASADVTLGLEVLGGGTLSVNTPLP